MSVFAVRPCTLTACYSFQPLQHYHIDITVYGISYRSRAFTSKDVARALLGNPLSFFPGIHVQLTSGEITAELMSHILEKVAQYCPLLIRESPLPDNTDDDEQIRRWFDEEEERFWVKLQDAAKRKARRTTLPD